MDKGNSECGETKKQINMKNVVYISNSEFSWSSSKNLMFFYKVFRISHVSAYQITHLQPSNSYPLNLFSC